MAGQRVSDFSISDPNGEALILSSQKSYRGHIELTLTNMDNTSAPQIAAGSVVEVGGALYEFPSAESITGSPSDGTVYVKLIPNGASTTAEYTNTAPTWSDAKQGWYGTGATAGHRYVADLVKISSSYYGKRILPRILSGVVSFSAAGEVTTTSTTVLDTLSGGFSGTLYMKKGESLLLSIAADIKTTTGTVYYGIKETAVGGNIGGGAVIPAIGAYAATSFGVVGAVIALITSRTSYSSIFSWSTMYTALSDGDRVFTEMFFLAGAATGSIQNRSLLIRKL